MTLFIPSLDKTKIYSDFNQSRMELFTEIERFFPGSIVFHKLDVDIDFLEKPGFLDWFDYVIVERSKGIICITTDNNYLTGHLYVALEDISEFIQNGRIQLIKNPVIVDAFFQAKNIFMSWGRSNKYELKSVEIINYLKKAMQIESLPPKSFSGKISINDERFLRLSKNHKLLRHIESELNIKELDRSKKINIQFKTCAGSGKTIAAKYAYKRLNSIGLKSIFVCYNHLLGNWLRNDLNPESIDGYVGTIFHFARKKIQYFHGQGNKLPCSMYDNLIEFLYENLKSGKYIVEDSMKFDALIIDEGQDFLPLWMDMLKYFIKEENACCLWFEDDNQNILMDNNSGLNHINNDIFFKMTSIVPFPFIDANNLRTPIIISHFMTNFFGYYDSYNNTTFSPHILPTKNLINGHSVEINFYAEENIIKSLKYRIDSLIDSGIAKENIIILSCLPPDNDYSSLLQKDYSSIQYDYKIKKIHNYKLQRDTGCYDETGRKIYNNTENGIRCESIYKYKGLEDAVVLVIDIEKPDYFTSYEWAKILYCTFTRATIHLEVFVCNEGNMSELFRDVNAVINRIP